MGRMSADWTSERRILAGLRGKRGEVIRLIALQPYRSTSTKHLNTPEPVPVPVHRS